MVLGMVLCDYIDGLASRVESKRSEGEGRLTGQ